MENEELNKNEVNFNEESGSFEFLDNDDDLIPEGDCEFEILDSVQEISRKGSDMFKWVLNAIEYDRQLIIYTVTTPKKRWSFKELLGACDIYKDEKTNKYNFTYDDVINKRIIGKVKHEKEEYNGRERKKETIISFKKIK